MSFGTPVLTLDTPMPTQAMVFHGVRDLSPFGSHETAFVTLHEVMANGQGAPVIGAGKHADSADIAELLKWMVDRQEASAPFLPANVLSLSNRHLVWTMKGMIRPLWFKAGEMNIRLDVHWPNLVVGVCGNQLRVAALAGGNRPRLSARLYHAPLMNVNGAGVVCTGGADLPRSCDLNAMPAWESILTDTFFSHVNHTASLRLPAKEQADEVDTVAHLNFWRELESRQATRFPKENLRPMGRNLEWFIQEVSRGR